MTLYKYVTNVRLDILKNQKIRYTQPAYLNDPYEMLPNIQQLVSPTFFDENFNDLFEQKLEEELFNKIPTSIHPYARDLFSKNIPKETVQRNLKAYFRVMEPMFLEKFDEELEKQLHRGVGVLSLSENCDDLLMWAHYADQHRGFVIGVDEKHPALDARRSENDEFFHPRKVIYSNERPEFKLSDLDGIDLLLTKSKHWSYEMEWRVVKPISGGVQSDENENVVFYDLPADAIESVIFGSGMPDDKRQDIAELLLSDERYSHIVVKEAKLQKGSFALKIRSLNFMPVIHEINKNSSIEVNDIEDQKNANKLGQKCAGAVNAINRTGLDLRCLEKINIVGDLNQIAENMWGKKVLPYSKNTFVFGFASEDTIQIHLYIKSDDVLGFLEDDNDLSEEALYNFQNALVRAHDLTNRWRMFGEEGLTRLPLGRLQYLEGMVSAIWVEYLVSRKSFTSKKDNLDIITNDLKVRFDISGKLIMDKIVEYRTHGNLELLLSDILPVINKCMTSAASVLGLLHRLDKKVSGFNFEEAELKVLAKLSTGLNYLHRYYPNWDGVDEFLQLTQVIEAYALNFNICFDDLENDKIWIAVL